MCGPRGREAIHVHARKGVFILKEGMNVGKKKRKNIDVIGKIDSG